MNTKHKKGSFWLIVLTVLLAAGSYCLLTWKNTNQRSLPPALVSPTPPQRENWQKQDLSFFSFKYPADWVERRAVTGGVLMLGPAGEETVWLGVGKTLNINPGATPTKLAGQALRAGEEVLVKKEIYLDGHPTVVQKRKSETGVRLEAYIGLVKSPANLNGEEKLVFGTQLVFMEARSPEATSSAERTFDEILTTFRYPE